LQPGDYHEDEFGPPDSNDVVLFSGVLNAEGEESCVRLLRKAHRSLAPGGLLVVRDYLLDETGGAQVAALFSLHMMLVTEHGQTHFEADMAEWVSRAGFQNPTIKHMPAPDESTLVIAVK
ncbi:MAG: methyltransferase, partial [Anaerolineales bacterium]